MTDKGGMILHMLHWVIGDQAFDKTMRDFLAQYAGKSATVDDFRQVAEQASGQQLTWFFTQWLDSTGAPEFKNKYTIYRTQKGFRVVGEIQQDLDLFRMPVELKIDTDGKTRNQAHRSVGHELGVCGRDLRQAAQDHRRSQQPRAEEFAASCRCAPPSCAASRTSSRAT